MNSYQFFPLPSLRELVIVAFCPIVIKDGVESLNAFILLVDSLTHCPFVFHKFFLVLLLYFLESFPVFFLELGKLIIRLTNFMKGLSELLVLLL